jgi:hypothetical protein
MFPRVSVDRVLAHDAVRFAEIVESLEGVQGLNDLF